MSPLLLSVPGPGTKARGGCPVMKAPGWPRHRRHARRSPSQLVCLARLPALLCGFLDLGENPGQSPETKRKLFFLIMLFLGVWVPIDRHRPPHATHATSILGQIYLAVPWILARPPERAKSTLDPRGRTSAAARAELLGPLTAPPGDGGGGGGGA